MSTNERAKGFYSCYMTTIDLAAVAFAMPSDPCRGPFEVYET